MSQRDHDGFQALLRRAPEAFVIKCFNYLAPSQKLTLNWHIQAMAWHLEQVRLGNIRRLIINLPPRHLKSVVASVAFPAFVLGHDPAKRIICASYGNDLSEKLALDCRRIMTSVWYRELFPGTKISREKNSVTDFITTKGGNRLATSTGGVLTGRGGSLIIIDDPMKADDAMSDTKRKGVCEWFDNTLYTRLDDKRNDAIVVVMQRLHQEDLVGHLLAKGEQWVVLNLSSIAEIEQTIQIGAGRFHHRRVGDLLQPAREPMSVLDDLKRTLGNFSFSAQYQQAPIPVDGEIFKWSWFKFYEEEPARAGGQIIQSWDTASKSGELNDYSVCTTWLIRDNLYYLLDVFRKRLGFPDLRQAVVEQRDRWKPSAVLIEDKASGMALIQDLRRPDPRGTVHTIAIEPEGDKLTRASAQSLAAEAGQIYLPRSAPWLADFRTEIAQFPNGSFDDQIDSMTQFLGWQRRPRMGAYKVKLGGI